MVIFAEPARIFEPMEKAINYWAHTRKECPRVPRMAKWRISIRGKSYGAWQHHNKPCSREADEIAEAVLKKLLASGVDMQVTGKCH